MNKRIDLLFVCLGNICRSPTAEAIMMKMVEDAGLTKNIFCDSAGTNGLHDGEKADPRAIAAGKKRGYDLKSISRKFNASRDFETANYIIAMDDINFKDLQKMDRNKKFQDGVFRIVDFCKNRQCAGVPDPYFGGEEGFDEVIDILEDACAGLLEKLKTDHQFE